MKQMKLPTAPKRWLEEEKNAFSGQLFDWYCKIDSYARQGGKLEIMDRLIEQFLEVLKTKKDLSPWNFPYEHNLKKTRAYAYRSAFRYDDALSIFHELRKKDGDNYHLVEDCIETYLAKGEYKVAVEFLNKQPIALIASETSEAADHIIGWVKEYSDFDVGLSAEIRNWANLNQSN